MSDVGNVDDCGERMGEPGPELLLRVIRLKKLPVDAIDDVSFVDIGDEERQSSAQSLGAL